MNTAFHEFGHNLHQIFPRCGIRASRARACPATCGVPLAGERDVDGLAGGSPHYAKHHRTGEPIPAELVAKVEAAAKFQPGVRDDGVPCRLPARSRLGIRSPPPRCPRLTGGRLRGPRRCNGRGGFCSAVPPRYRSTYFSHLFANSYSAGYYAY
ncbi:MAG: hypothetical protein IPL39_11570, partial [Opitutaceae bacterium]|nr:hypothetical protein [Opitutaceae bacterium]